MSAIEVSAGLLAEVKNYLDITWDADQYGEPDQFRHAGSKHHRRT